MNHGVFFNVAILLFVLGALYVTHNPLVILVLPLLIERLPFGLLAQGPPEEDDDPKIGFNAAIS